MNEQLRFALLLMPGFSLLSLGAFIDKLRFSADEEDYSQQIHCRWCVVGLAASAVLSSSNVSVMPEMTLPQLMNASQAERPDYLVIFGSNRVDEACRLAATYAPFIKGLYKNRVKLVSIDNAAFVLATSGLVKHQKVVLHWRHVNQFRQAFPAIEVMPNHILYEDNGIISCVGGSATVEVAIYILEKHMGAVKAFKGLADMIINAVRPMQQNGLDLPELASLSRPVSQAIALMYHAVGRKTDMSSLAQQVGISRRQLDRDFLNETGLSSHDYFIALKITQIQWLLRRSSSNLSHIAQEVGMNDASYLCRVFKRETGLTPYQYREQYRQPMTPP